MESKTKNRKTRAQVARMVERAFGGTTLATGEDAMRELKEGWFNAAYTVRLSDGREVILKIAPPEDAEVLAYEKNIMTTEVASLRLVRENPTIPVPEIYYFDTTRDVCDSDYYFMEKLAGDNYEHVKASFSPAMQVQLDQQIGVIVREINGFTGTYFGYDGNSDLRGETWKETFIKIMDSVLEDGSSKHADFGYAIDEIREVVMKHASSLEAVTIPQLVHWDAWDLNFFVRDGKVTGIIDFERALWADPLMEAQFRALALGGVSESMRSYGKTTFTHEEDERCHLYTLHLALVMKTECYYRNYDSDFVSNQSKQLMVPTMNWLKENLY
ncbi:aminoglycoside phosphotransferase [Dictyobacter vulcani]|uniref:Aminoglycoside phosphotransferase n=1 Tax=Dictyobacter vulcani TaxID=2607529 RepID=A0A5J4KTS2_9CHLR|nr:phosphotransferase [Dictyobacter vulcani]GER89870.1 aminoglycoside phosphotransferase [Dictyobacter vulcani]